MKNNEIIRSLCRSLALTDLKVAELMSLVGPATSPELARSIRVKSSDPDHVACSSEQLAQLLDGLIESRRGARTSTAPPAPLTTNGILKKLRIALVLDETTMLRIFAQGGVPLERRELGALFRNPDHRAYVAAKDQVLKGFLAGLEARQATTARAD